MCALIYQTAWLREFRLIFGASTAASAAVLGIFMGGLGLGGLLIGKRVDQNAQPLRLYGHLELLIALSTALTPFLVWVIRQLYIVFGGSTTLGLTGGTLVRLLFSALVLSVPTFLMGGTLPAAARAVETEGDQNRRNLALLYGMNTLGAVTGTVLSTFYMLEIYGNRATLWTACLVNMAIALAALKLAPGMIVENVDSETEPVQSEAGDDLASGSATRQGVPAMFILAAAGLVGFAFLLMEIVWYRMLGPLLGGSTFTFGLILAVALLGIGLGGAIYSVFGGNRTPTISGFALTCVLEAVCIAIPYALGDRLALLTILLRPLGSIGFSGHLLGWSIITVITIFPAALVAGIQFPLLIALLGKGKKDIGQQVGLAYAWNTVGAIIGSLAGGFGLLPLLSSIGTWKLIVFLLVGQGGIALALSFRESGNLIRLIPSSMAAVLAVLLVLTAGPTTAWRHSPIGAGRADLPGGTMQSLTNWLQYRRRAIYWEAEGVESSVALSIADGFAFVVNGKTDGHVRADAGTQILSGLLGAMVHPHPKKSLVVGLGTGCTAGWLATVPTMERVDVIELEPAILEVARACAPVNMNAMDNPKVKIHIGDAREVMITTPESYDLIFSEPSNPYRAGISSLFTRECYLGVAQRLNENGIFMQWVQGYEVDSKTIRTTYATLASVFPTVETWQTQDGDLLLFASKKPIVYDLPAIRTRIKEEPYKTSLMQVWRVTSVEGLFSHYLANARFAQAVAAAVGPNLNTDDRNNLEFGFARNVGSQDNFRMIDLIHTATRRKECFPLVTGGELNWKLVEDMHMTRLTNENKPPESLPSHTPEQKIRLLAQSHYVKQEFKEALAMWRLQPRYPQDLTELTMLAECLADAGDEGAFEYLNLLKQLQPVEAQAILARLRWRQGRLDEATAALESVFQVYHSNPWPSLWLMTRTVGVAESVAKSDPGKQFARRLYTALKTPFCAYLINETRLSAQLEIARYVEDKALLVETFTAYEPNFPWQASYLVERYQLYRELNHPLAAQAEHDIHQFLRYEASPFDEGL
ncbi:MAG TPA: fused MFS/spermidine synthase [Acidobacteriota bacterium]|nr:fused MFS/spermidine synthase [Acidobacteriota bacterium]